MSPERLAYVERFVVNSTAQTSLRRRPRHARTSRVRPAEPPLPRRGGPRPLRYPLRHLRPAPGADRRPHLHPHEPADRGDGAAGDGEGGPRRLHAQAGPLHGNEGAPRRAGEARSAHHRRRLLQAGQQPGRLWRHDRRHHEDRLGGAPEHRRGGGGEASRPGERLRGGVLEGEGRGDEEGLLEPGRRRRVRRPGEVARSRHATAAMAEPRELAERAERAALPPWRDHERFAGYGVMGLPFASGHVLGMRRFPASSVGPGYTSVWRRTPAGDWTFYSDVEPLQSCNRFFGSAVETFQRTTIALDWTGTRSLRIEVAPAGLLS